MNKITKMVFSRSSINILKDRAFELCNQIDLGITWIKFCGLPHVLKGPISFSKLSVQVSKSLKKENKFEHNVFQREKIKDERSLKKKHDLQSLAVVRVDF